MPERFPHNATWAGKIYPSDLTHEERLDIAKGVLGYCEGHGILYKKWAINSCTVPSIFPDGLGRICKEWSTHGLFTRIIAERIGRSQPRMNEQGEPNYDGWRWISTKHLWKDEKVYCHFCDVAVTYSPDEQVKSGIVHVLLDEEEFDCYMACKDCTEKVIGDLYPPREKLEEAAKSDGIPACTKCGKQIVPSFMHGWGIVEGSLSCCHEWVEPDLSKWPYKACEAVFKESPISKSFFARRGYGGGGVKAASILYHERKLRELQKTE
jgi:hypothetical protein